MNAAPVNRLGLSTRLRSRPLVALCVAALSLGSMLSADAATRVVIRGRVIDTRIEAPQYPSSRAECAQFNEEVGELASVVNEEHEACLANKGIPNGPGGTCTKPGCQKLHDAREELNALRSKGYAQCNAAVNERQRSERWGNSGYKTDLEEFKSSLKAGPVSAVKNLVKQQISDVIDKTFGYASPIVKDGLNVGMAANTMVSSFAAMQKACKEKSRVALNACNREMLTAIQSLPSMVPSKYSGDPGISMIQDAMMTRLNLMMRDTLDQMDRVSEQIDEVTEDRPPPSRRRRITPRIENN
jgi:hypothetical protein